MRTIIAGSRGIIQIGLIVKATTQALSIEGIRPTVVLSGCAPGADQLAIRWARMNKLPIERFPAKWRDERGVLNKGAGFQRNELMAIHAEALIAVWDGHSPGTGDMIKRAHTHGLKVHVHLVDAAFTRRGLGLNDPV